LVRRVLWISENASWITENESFHFCSLSAPATADYTPSDPQIAWYLAQFIQDVRGVPADPIVVRQNWLQAYDFTTTAGATASVSPMIQRTVSPAATGPEPTSCSPSCRATSVISPGADQAHGIIRAPGLHRPDQIAAWRKITDAVHAAGGRIYGQIWHCGRVAHPGMRGGEQPVGPSPIPATGDFFLPTGRVEFPVPRELRIDEIPGIVADFAQATRNAREAGFDGVELHGANGYLQDQFLQDGNNQRADAYGGPIENRARLMLETTQAMIDAWSANRVGVRLSPSSFLYGVDDGDKLATFGFVVRALDALGVGFLCLLEPNAKGAARGVQIRNVAETFRPMTSVPIIVNTGFDKAKANEVLSKGHANLVAFGVPFIANPDLVERLRSNAPLNKPDPTTFYGIGPKGYTDYPMLADAVAA
jgi:N-ethylmaleimide reductase